MEVRHATILPIAETSVVIRLVPQITTRNTIMQTAKIMMIPLYCYLKEIKPFRRVQLVPAMLCNIENIGDKEEQLQNLINGSDLPGS